MNIKLPLKIESMPEALKDPAPHCVIDGSKKLVARFADFNAARAYVMELEKAIRR